MDKAARTIVRTLNNAGYIAYYAGGWVRDLLMGHLSTDIDIATSASPEEIIKLFPKTIPVGISFGVVIVLQEGHSFEVSTFRKDGIYIDGRHPQGVALSNPEEDAKRRDFTINGMFYDPLTDEIIDYVGGQDDIESKIIRTIGDADLRFTEDRLRMVRAIRFATRFNFHIENETKQAIVLHASSLFPAVSMERIWQELTKMSKSLRFDQALVELHSLQLLQEIFPNLRDRSSSDIKAYCHAFNLFPSNTPTICYILELFPHHNLKFKIDLCHRLKATKADEKLVEFFHLSEELLNRYIANEVVERADWAHFFSHPHSRLFLPIFFSKFKEDERKIHEAFFVKLFHSLESHVERIQEHKPIVSSHHLITSGLKPGKAFGVLLKEAERLSINENILNSDVLLNRLKQSALWPEH